MAQEDFVTFDQAMKLKELGFNWKCISVYDEKKDFKIFKHFRNFNEEKEYYISAPTLSQAQKWLREVKKEHIIVCLDRWVTNKPYRFDLYQEFGEELYGQCVVNDFQTYEEALSAGIDAALESIGNG